MKLTKLATLMATSVSCVYLTQCTTPVHYVGGQSQTTANTADLPYPPTRTHQLDKFLHGEFGLSENTAATNNAVHSPTAPDDGIDHYPSATVVDKYRWLEEYDPIDAEHANETTQDRQRNFIGTRLEDDRPESLQTRQALQTVDEHIPSSEVNRWVDAQNALTESYIEDSPFYEQLRKNAESLYNQMGSYTRIRTNKHIGEIRFYLHKDRTIHIERIGLDGTKTQLIGEKDLPANYRILSGGSAISKKGSYLAFVVRDGSADSDNYYMYVIDTHSGKIITQIKTSRNDNQALWLDDDRFYYLAPNIKDWRNAIYLRDLKKPSFQDKLIVKADHIDGMHIESMAIEGDDDRYLVMNTSWRGANATAHILDTKTGDIYRVHDRAYFNKNFAKAEAFNNKILAQLVHFDPKTRDVYIISGENNPKGEIIKTNLDNLRQRQVVVPAPKDHDITRDAYYHEEGTGYFVISYLKDGISRVILADASTGQHLKDLTPPQGAGHASNLSGNVVDNKKDKKDDKDPEDDIKIDTYAKENYVQFRYENPTMPAHQYKYSIAKGEFLDIRRHDLTPFDTDAYETKLVFYTAKDGTKVPMNISYKKGIKLDGKNPTMLYGYGGYGVIYDQAFGFPADTMWLENGGVWAHAMIRGGGEYGEEWQRAAQEKNRLVGYDDFAAAADYLAQEGYASPDYLAIIGGSNGGLLVGAAMVRHPEKYRVAIPEVAVLDMLRHEKMGITSYWMGEYGTPEQGRKMYDILMSYSPLHNIKAGVCYPSTLIPTSKRDDRVVPSHSYKMTAVMQEHSNCGKPALLYAGQYQGHSANIVKERLANSLMVNAFALKEMGIKEVPVIAKRPTADELKTPTWLAEEAKKREKQEKERQKRQAD